MIDDNQQNGRKGEAVFTSGELTGDNLYHTF